MLDFKPEQSRSVTALYSWMNHEVALAALAAAPNRQTMREVSNPEPIAAIANADAVEAGSHREMNIRQHIAFLADDALEGRMTGSEGAKRAAAHIASQFTALNLKPVGDETSYFQEFEFTAGDGSYKARTNFTSHSRRTGSNR